MTLESTKIIGGMGAVLLFLGVIPIRYAGIISLVGLILVLIALYGFAASTARGGIFKQFL